MQIQVKLFATLVNYRPGVKAGVPFVLEIDEGTTLTDLMRCLEIPEKEVKLAFVNGRLQPNSYKLKNGDDTGIFPPIGGG